MLRSPFLMPFLLRNYPYPCFKEFHDRLERQYHAMPEVFKGIFTLDERGEPVLLMDTEEAKKRLEALGTAQSGEAPTEP